MDKAPQVVHDLDITIEDEVHILRAQRNDMLNQITHSQILNSKLRDLVDKLSAELMAHSIEEVVSEEKVA